MFAVCMLYVLFMMRMYAHCIVLFMCACVCMLFVLCMCVCCERAAYACSVHAVCVLCIPCMFEHTV